uniref:Chitin-binding type-2 domain-containing protein n=1 Tax=Strigamia maritima TaxID=126957 RepID=T1IMS5_STRMM
MKLILLWIAILVFVESGPPNFNVYEPPETSFTCSGKVVGGYYADPEASCQLFHICVQDFRFLCPNDTLFDQENFVCADWRDVECALATQYYDKNLDLSKRQLGQPVGVPCYSYEDMPRTGFSCQGMIPGGYYADPATNCQMYHVCAPGVSPGIMIDFKFLCTNNTVFDQRTRTCMDFDAVDCLSSVSYYGVNTDLVPPPLIPDETELLPLPPVIPPTILPITVLPTQQARKIPSPKKTTWRITRPIPVSTTVPSTDPLPTIPPTILPILPDDVPAGFNGILLPTVFPPQVPPIINNGQDIPLPSDGSEEGAEIDPVFEPEMIPVVTSLPDIPLTTPKAFKKPAKGNNNKNGKKIPQPNGPFGLPIDFMPPDFLPPDFLPPNFIPPEAPFADQFQPNFFPPQSFRGAKSKASGSKKTPFQGNQLGFPELPLPIDPNFELVDYPGDFFPMGFNVPESQKLNPKPTMKPGKGKAPSFSNLPILPIQDVTFGQGFHPVPAGSEFVEMWIQPSPIYVQGIRVIRQVGPAFVTTHVLPVTSFTCRDKITGGYYADTETDCQMFHVCARGNDNEVFDFKFLCTNETVFNQKSQTCEPRTHVACHSSSLLYPAAFSNIEKKLQAEADEKINVETEDEEVLPLDLVKKKRSHDIEEHLPKTSFTCRGKPIGGYFADVEAECRTFHVCSRSQTG